MKPILFIALLPLPLAAACTTTTETRLAEERASCERMAQRMDTARTHAHAQMKGVPGNRMNARHRYCARLLEGADSVGG